jgi:hypothetical protein
MFIYMNQTLVSERARAQRKPTESKDTITCRARPLRSRTLLRQRRSPSLSAGHNMDIWNPSGTLISGSRL